MPVFLAEVADGGGALSKHAQAKHEEHRDWAKSDGLDESDRDHRLELRASAAIARLAANEGELCL